MVKLRSGFIYNNVGTYNNLVLEFNKKIDNLSLNKLNLNCYYKLIKKEKKNLDININSKDRIKIYETLEYLISKFLINLKCKSINFKYKYQDIDCLICYSKIGYSKTITCKNKQHIFHKKCFIMSLDYSHDKLNNLHQCPYCLQFNIEL